jgi:hypothetical protein
MAQATESSVSAILKEVYPGSIEDELNNEVGLYSIVEKEKVTIDGQGQHLVRPFRVGRNQGLGARNDTDILPQPGSQQLLNAKINMSSNYLIGQITGRTIRTSYGSDAAFQNALSEEIQFNLTDIGSEIGYQVYGLMGQRATVNGTVTASTSVVVTNTQYLAVGMVVEFWNGATNQTTNDTGLPTGITGTQITAINNTTNTLTVTTAQTITTGAGVSRAQNNTAQTTTKELYGLDFFGDNNTDYPGLTYFGASRVANPILNGNRFDATHTLSENLMQQAFDAARQIGGGIINFITCDYATRRVYTNLLTSLKRYPLEGVQAPQFSGGLQVSQDLRNQLGEGLSFSGAPVAPSRLAPPAKMYGFPTTSLKFFQQSEIEWLMNGDSILHPLLSVGFDAYRFALFLDAQFYNEAPNRMFKIVNTY